MERNEILLKVQGIIRDVFDNDELVITDTTTAKDVQGWDSLMHITLISSLEDEFDIKFAMKDVVCAKNVGQLVDLIIDQIE